MIDAKQNSHENNNFFEIARESSNLSIEDFLQHYYHQERPVIIENVGTNWPAKQCWNEHYIRERLAIEPGAETASLWYWMESGSLEGDYQTPKLISAILDSEDIFPRKKIMRIWAHAKDNKSSWHYDTNMVNVFNVQVTGRKLWSLVSPDTPLDCYPWSNFAIIKRDETSALQKKIHTQFTLNSGDMLYIPPLWFHQVTALDAENINLNWVFTKKKTDISSRALLRELERVQLMEFSYRFGSKLHSKLKKIIKSKIPGYLRARWRYSEMIQTKQPQRRFKLIRRSLEELSLFGKVALHAREIKPYLSKVKTVKKLPAKP